MANEKRRKGQTRVDTTQTTKDPATGTPLTTEGELM